jgi:hypothetical protein
MKTAYFIALHHKINQFRWLFEAIYSEDDVYCIHVDRKSDNKFYEEVKNYVGSRANVTFLQPKLMTWGGWSQVAIELDAIRVMLKADSDWKYFINLSGQDYPIKPIALIKEKLQNEWPRNFIRAWTFATIKELEPNDPHLTRIFAFEAFGRLVRTRIKLPFPRSMDIKFKGSNWHMLTRDFCQWLADDPLTKRVARQVQYIVSPDEVFFQALIMNSPFKDLRTEDSYRFVIWPGPKTLRSEDYENILLSNCLFARKFDETVDREILSRLASDLGYSVPSSTHLIKSVS